MVSRYAAAFLFLASNSLSFGEDKSLAANFASPPTSAAPQTWWHWINGNITKEGITADLEAMKRVGLGGATIVNISDGPAGQIDFMSDSWREMVQHAVRESDRLGLEIGVENCAGWSSSGGPWVTPDQGMQMVSYSQKRLHGPGTFTGPLDQPFTRLNCYRDIAVLAYPTPRIEMEGSGIVPKITSGDPKFDPAPILKNDGLRGANLSVPSTEKSEYLQFEYDQPFCVRTVALSFGGGCKGYAVIQASDDRKQYRDVRQIYFTSGDMTPLPAENYEIEPTTARFFRINFLKVEKSVTRITILRAELRTGPAIDNFGGKADYIRDDHILPASTAAVPPEMVIDPTKVVNLTANLDAKGVLTWTIPPGDWTILRLGYTPTGVTNHPAPKSGQGLEVDKLSRPALKNHWDHMMAKIIADSGPLAGKTLNHTLIDSYEVGSENWTAAMPDEFKKRTGYDLIPYLPVLAGNIVGSVEQSDRVLWDFRRTIADLFAENYFDYMGELARQSGLQLSTEPYGDGPFDDLLSGRGADVPMTEFWIPGPGGRGLKEAATISHIYGRTLTGAESFTGESSIARWQQYPALLKPLGDYAFTCGINHMSFHRFAHQPWLDRVPGMTAGPWGTMLERTNTWWEQGAAWIHYLTRCQYLLQQGLFVADALVLVPEGSPSNFISPDMPAGHDWDGCNSDAVLHRLSVQNGRLTLPDGMSYRVLVLPRGDAMTPELLQKIMALADGGVTIIGPEPSRSPSYRGFPHCDEEVKSLAVQLWKTGKIADQPIGKVFSAINLPPDFECSNQDAIFPYIHRVMGDRDIYFVSNQRLAYQETDCLFRISGKVPELWHPDTGQIESVPIYSEEQGRTRVHLRLDPGGSVFVVFQKPSPINHLIALTESVVHRDTTPAATLEITHGIFESKTDPAASADVTAKLNGFVKDGAISITASVANLGEPAPMQLKQLRVNYIFNGKPDSVTVPESGELSIPSEVKNAKFSDAVLKRTPSGKLVLEAWHDGTYDMKSRDGTTRSVEVASLPSRVVIGGQWNIDFPPNRGAPAHAAFDSLGSWSDRPEQGIKYFSGTAIYTTKFSLDPSQLLKNGRWYLDLGNVQVIAEVKLNGRSLGTLWKPPFCVETGDSLRSGVNSLEVKVTNLWVNRLIGDEQLPSDREWVNPNGLDTGLKSWPQWLLDGKPSPTGRVTFTTWHHWGKDDPLKESGLLGPVQLVPSIVRDLDAN